MHSSLETKDGRIKALEHLFETELVPIQFNNIKGIKAQYYYLHTLSLIFHSIKKYKYKYLATLEQMKEILVSNDKVFEKKDAFTVISNLAGRYIIVKEKEKFHICIKEMDDIIAASTEVPSNNLLYWRHTRLCEFYTSFTEEIMPDTTITTIINFIDKDVVLKSHQIGIIHALSKYYFVKRNYKQSKAVLDKIFLEKHIKTDNFYLVLNDFIW